jgi:hypothetical protein
VGWDRIELPAGWVAASAAVLTAGGRSRWR